MAKDKKHFYLINNLQKMITEIIQKHLPEHLRELASSFNIEGKFIINNTQLIQLILKSKSIAENSEKQYWFNLLPVMSEEQIGKLDNILTRERDKLAEIEQKYQKKQEEIQERFDKFSSSNYQKTQEIIQQKEENIREEEIDHAENLLSQI